MYMCMGLRFSTYLYVSVFYTCWLTCLSVLTVFFFLLAYVGTQMSQRQGCSKRCRSDEPESSEQQMARLNRFFGDEKKRYGGGLERSNLVL